MSEVYTNAQVAANPALAKQGKLVSADELKSAAQGHAGKTIVQATLTVDAETGEYVVRFPGTIPLTAVTRSSTGKSFIATVRAEMGRSKEPILVQDGEDTIPLCFGSFNINLTLQPKG